MPLQVKIQITYENLKCFHYDLKLISRMGDVDVSYIGDMPSEFSKSGRKKLDQELMQSIEEYLNRFSSNPSVLNLIVFKKFISDNVIIDGEIEEDKYFNERRDTFGSATGGDQDAFNISSY